MYCIYYIRYIYIYVWYVHAVTMREMIVSGAVESALNLRRGCVGETIIERVRKTRQILRVRLYAATPTPGALCTYIYDTAACTYVSVLCDAFASESYVILQYS